MFSLRTGSAEQSSEAGSGQENLRKSRLCNSPKSQLFPAGLPWQRCKALSGVFVRVFGMNRLALTENELLFADKNALRLEALQMHLDPGLPFIPDGAMRERIQTECA